MPSIHVEVSKSYDIYIEAGIFQHIPELIKNVCLSKRLVVVTDNIVAQLYIKDLRNLLIMNGFEVFIYEFPHGEQNKNIETLSNILQFMADKHIHRNDTLLALGGGVVGDIVGLAAAMYMRGISVIQIPTTLLSAIDSSVGGKTAINLKNGKNLVGVFWQPSLVICDVNIIKNLPRKIFEEGMAEVIKCNLIKSLPIIEWIQQNSLEQNIEQLIYQCLVLKRDIVEQDEYDKLGIRNILNVGHTVAHAIEKLSDYAISHGKAVGTGLVIEAKIAEKIGLCKEDTATIIKNAVMKCNLMIDLPWKSELIANAMKNDKKNMNDKIVFELPLKLGECKEVKLEKEALVGLLDDIHKCFGFDK